MLKRTLGPSVRRRVSRASRTFSLSLFPLLRESGGTYMHAPCTTSETNARTHTHMKRSVNILLVHG